ncbi:MULTISPECIES: hypothetical protein [Thalassospira]|jgi:hypothetical protein|nr:hypothetical protein [Thalassospira lohafexi]|tara:strand:+ start:6147 stop:6533 length:387 start_codon:yes stop_codon:yes gene_type:complete
MATREQLDDSYRPLTQSELQSLKHDMQNSLHMMQQQAFLKSMAKRYIWWKSPDEAIANPDRVLAQLMNIGDFDDVVEMVKLFGNERLGHVVSNAVAGWFNERSWSYWHYRLGLADIDHVPAIPVRRFD